MSTELWTFNQHNHLNLSHLPNETFSLFHRGEIHFSDNATYFIGTIPTIHINKEHPQDYE